MLQAKNEEELAGPRISQRKAESIDSAVRDSKRQIGELMGIINDQIFHQKRVGEHMDDFEYEENGDSDDEDCDLQGITPRAPLSDIEGGPEMMGQEKILGC